ncbi:energy transducer TonB [Dysgonomonas sp. HDW5A]|uniref:energy transducer TonB n=1 Tax=Dysgonomonas sp. HDW5A TaxID=2714926 RepID=UPI00140A237A|nr:energy transducer TonB [Dysgonomonas sp. HDW5A]QIK58745.1 energy transducer TonB [Dysgonomonas sp. HDW5A]
MRVLLLALLLLFSISFYAQTNDNKPNMNHQDSIDAGLKVKIPEFPDGIDALIAFLGNNLKYPLDAEKQKIEGRVLVQFIVSTTGDVENITILQKLSPSCDEEAIRVTQLMPKWIPGEMKGKKVNTIFKLPFNFSLPQK